MPGVLGDGSTLGMGTQKGILGYGAPSIMIRQIGVPMGAPPAPGAGYGFGMGGGQAPMPEYGSDEWAQMMAGPNVMIWREMMAALGGKDPNAIFDTGKDGPYSGDTRGLLGDKYQKAK